MPEKPSCAKKGGRLSEVLPASTAFNDIQHRLGWEKRIVLVVGFQGVQAEHCYRAWGFRST